MYSVSILPVYQAKKSALRVRTRRITHKKPGVRGHPFMMSTRRGRGSSSGGRMWTEGGGQVHADVHTDGSGGRDVDDREGGQAHVDRGRGVKNLIFEWTSYMDDPS